MRTPAMVSINGADPVPGEVSVETEMIDVSTMTASRPDMRWEYVDAAGHFHAYDNDGNLPTLVRRDDNPRSVAEEYYDDEYVPWHLECDLCGEEIQPQRLADDPHRTIPGRTTFTVTVQAKVPQGRFSVVATTPDRVWFGVGEGHVVRAESFGAGVTVTSMVWCGPMSWRPKVSVPA